MHLRPVLAHGGELAITALILIGVIITSALALAYGKKILSTKSEHNAHKVFAYFLLTIATIGGIIVFTVFCFFIYIDFFSHSLPIPMKKKLLLSPFVYLLSWIIAYAIINGDLNLAIAWDYFIKVITNNEFVRPTYTLCLSVPIFLIIFFFIPWFIKWFVTMEEKVNTQAHTLDKGNNTASEQFVGRHGYMLPTLSLEAQTAKRLIHKLEDAALRFRVEADDSSLKNISPASAHRGGTFGLGAKLMFYVHIDDCQEFDAIHLNLIDPPQLEAEPPPWCQLA